MPDEQSRDIAPLDGIIGKPAERIAQLEQENAVVQASGRPESLFLSPQKGHQNGSKEEIIRAESISPSVYGWD